VFLALVDQRYRVSKDYAYLLLKDADYCSPGVFLQLSAGVL
jgi:hypothetical protein